MPPQVDETTLRAPGASHVSVRTVGAVVAAMVSAAVPPFLVGTLAVRIGQEMPFTAERVGVAVAVYYLVSAVLSPLGGRIVAILGPAAALRIACAASSAGLIVVATAQAPLTIVLALAWIGLPNALVQPASNQVLAAVEAPRARAFAFGLVQSSIPMATLLSGLLLAATTSGHSWRTVVWLVAVLSLAGALVAPSLPRNPRTAVIRGGSTSERLPLAPMVLAAFCASMAVTALPAFAATDGTERGIAPGMIAAAQIIGSLGCIAARISVTGSAARLTGPANLLVVAGMIALGSAGFASLAGPGNTLFVAGIILGYTCGWGWAGLFNISLAQQAPHRIATSTGLTQAGVFLGGAAGPLLFAAVVARHSYSAAWSVAAAIAALAVVLLIRAAVRWRADVRSER